MFFDLSRLDRKLGCLQVRREKKMNSWYLKFERFVTRVTINSLNMAIRSFDVCSRC